jgi:hypothetical protein
MAMKKSEMEAEHLQYYEKMHLASVAEQNGLYREAVNLAVSAWPFVDGMILHARKYEDREVTRIGAFDIVLRYAPLLLDSRPLDELAQVLTKYKRVLKDGYAVMMDQLARARSRVLENHRLWTHLEQNPGTEQERLRQVLGGDQEEWRGVAESWERMRLVSRTPAGRSYRLTLSTRMGEIVRAKCPRCGQVAEAPKAMFLDETTCPECGHASLFVLLAPPAATLLSKGLG